MNGYQPYNYQPAYNPYASSMPFPPRQDYGMQGYPPTQQNGQQTQQAQQCYACRPVTSREEAVAAQIDFMGPGTIMPDLGHGMIYLKRFNPNTGSSDFLPFVLQPPMQNQGQKEDAVFPSIQDFVDLQDTVKQLKEEVERLKRPTSGKAVKKNDADE